MISAPDPRDFVLIPFSHYPGNPLRDPWKVPQGVVNDQWFDRLTYSGYNGLSLANEVPDIDEIRG